MMPAAVVPAATPIPPIAMGTPADGGDAGGDEGEGGADGAPPSFPVSG